MCTYVVVTIISIFSYPLMNYLCKLRQHTTWLWDLERERGERRERGGGRGKERERISDSVVELCK